MIETKQKEKISSKEKKHLIRIRNIFLVIFGLFLIYLYVIIEPKKYFISFKPSKSNVTVIDEHFYDNEYYSVLDEDFMYHNDYWKKWWNDRQDVAFDEIHDDKVGYRPFELDFYTVTISKENLKVLEE